jgi:hypothetical protein
MKYELLKEPLISEITQWIMELMRPKGQLSFFIGVMIEQIIVPISPPIIVMGVEAIPFLPGLSVPNALLSRFFGSSFFPGLLPQLWAP